MTEAGETEASNLPGDLPTSPVVGQDKSGSNVTLSETKPKARTARKKRGKEIDETETADDKPPPNKVAKGKAGGRTAKSKAAESIKATEAAIEPTSGTSTPQLKAGGAAQMSQAMWASTFGGSKLSAVKIKVNQVALQSDNQLITTIQKGDTKATPSPAPTPEMATPTRPEAVKKDEKPALTPYKAVLSTTKEPPAPQRTANDVKDMIKGKIAAAEKSKFDLLRQSIEMQAYDDALGLQRKVWLGGVPAEHILPALSLAQDPKPASLPYPMQYGSGFWLCADQPAPMANTPIVNTNRGSCK